MQEKNSETYQHSMKANMVFYFVSWISAIGHDSRTLRKIHPLTKESLWLQSMVSIQGLTAFLTYRSLKCAGWPDLNFSPLHHTQWNRTWGQEKCRMEIHFLSLEIDGKMTDHVLKWFLLLSKEQNTMKDSKSRVRGHFLAQRLSWCVLFLECFIVFCSFWAGKVTSVLAQLSSAFSGNCNGVKGWTVFSSKNKVIWGSSYILTPC